MIIIPNNPYKTNSKAEYRVFDKIKESFINNNKYIAFHSLNLTKHERKRFGEADFVIVCEYGIFVFEVKGGGIGCDNEEWYTINRYNEEYKIQNPFKQAEGALHAILKEIQESHKFNNLRIPIGYGVIFPDVEWTHQGSEWDLYTICDSRKFKIFESWLRNFFKYWHNKSGNTYNLSSENINDLKQYLRPNFELIEPLHIKLSKLEDTAVALTQDQYKYLDIVAANKKVLCSGGAGTGKTFLAAELARRLANENTKIGLICKSNWLKRYLESKIKNEFVTISTIDSVRVDMRRSGLACYDILIVDEGQDLFDFDDIDILENLLDCGLADGEWYIFHDVNNQAGLFVDTKMEILELLESYSPAKIPLTTNCRNTSSILNKVQSLLHLDMGNKGTGIGPEVHEIINNKESGLILKNEINNILKNGIASESITILSPLSYEESSISFLPESIKNNITKLDDFSIRSFPVENISFSEIKNFKGLENEVIIVIDLINPATIDDSYNKVLHYVAMSRARALLCVIWE
ncbi:MAG: NERD domain-containing protein/DEAD/DEAH box helicase [Arcobacteraceae bacterium]|nr:NERD domain-containing protein/DEAD/DEAH box helicase [Arcobacteraceae bacterium]